MISISADVRQVTRRLDGAATRQIPFATANALNQVAHASAVAVRRAMPSTFDRPTPFTVNSVGTQPARKSTLAARVFIKDRQAEYLDVQETGGRGRPAKVAFVVPKHIHTNAYGNLPRGSLARAKSRPGVFVGQVGKVGGIFYRPPKPKDGAPRKAPVLLVRFVRQASYKPRFNFRARVERTVRATVPAAVSQALAQALSTAR